MSELDWPEIICLFGRGGLWEASASALHVPPWGPRDCLPFGG